MIIYFIFSGIMFLVVSVFITVVIVKSVKRWDKNNNSPVLTVNATAVAKRIFISSDGSIPDNNFMSNSTDYYVTFQVESGDRLEFYVSGAEYGQICEGDNGKLTFQGTRYLGFERQFANI